MRTHPGNATGRDGGVNDRAAARHGLYLHQPEPFTATVAGKPEGRGSMVGANEEILGHMAAPNRAIGDAEIARQAPQLRFERASSDHEHLAGDMPERGQSDIQSLVVDQSAYDKPKR